MRRRELEARLAKLRPDALLLGLALLFATGAGAGYAALLKPSLERLRALDTAGPAATIEGVEAQTAQTRAAIEVARTELGALRNRLYGGPSDLPPEKTESYIVDRLDRISEHHEVELLSVQPGTAKPILMFDELLYEVEVRGDFFALVHWLDELERELRPLVVNGFDMRPEAGGGKVGMKLRLASYRPSGDLS